MEMVTFPRTEGFFPELWGLDSDFASKNCQKICQKPRVYPEKTIEKRKNLPPPNKKITLKRGIGAMMTLGRFLLGQPFPGAKREKTLQFFKRRLGKTSAPTTKHHQKQLWSWCCLPLVFSQFRTISGFLLGWWITMFLWWPPNNNTLRFWGKHTVFFGEHFFDGDSWISGGCGFADNWELGCVKKPVILVMDYMED